MTIRWKNYSPKPRKTPRKTINKGYYIERLMTEEIKIEFDEKTGFLNVQISVYNAIIKDGELTDEFLNSLFEGYENVESSERKKFRTRLSWLKRFRETIRKNKKEYNLQIKGIQVYPHMMTDMESEYIRNIFIKCVGAETEYSRTVADRWELIEDLTVGADLLIDVSSVVNGLYRYISTGKIQEGFAGFGYLAVLGMALLIIYFILRIKGEEPNKRKNRYLTNILRTPITLHRKHRPQDEITFSPNSDNAL
jgi:hypothetical protein